MYASVVFDIALDREFDYILPEKFGGARVGARVRAPFGPRAAVGIITAVKETPSADIKLKEISDLLEERAYFSDDLFALAYYLKENYGGALGQILFSLIPFYAPKFPLTPARAAAEPAFNADEEQMYKEISASALYGGSGARTRDFALKSALRAAAQGQVLVTGPDIMSAEEIKKILETNFGAEVFLWHSKVTPSRKKEIFARLINGENIVVAGTRSSALLPFVNLKLAVMFNEEDADYKQEENRPFFHARDVLLHRKSKLLFVSESPSLEVCKMINERKINLIKMPASLSENEFARVSVARPDGKKAMSEQLVNEIRGAMTRGGKILLLLNRKAGADSYRCLNCGLSAVCPECKSVLTEEENDLKCPACGARFAKEQKCPKCQNLVFTSHNTGAGKAAAELKKYFKGINILKLDAAALTKNKNALSQDGAIILGTDAVLKAARFESGFSLVAVLDADSELGGADFRSGERLCQKLFAAKALASNSKNAALVIQSAHADNPIFKTVVHGDYFEFSAQEAEFREAFNFPPFSGLIKLVLQSKNEADARNAAREIKIFLTEAAPAAEVEGPVHSGKKTDAAKKVYLLVKTPDNKEIIKLLSNFKPEKTVKLKLVANPYSFF